MADAEQWHWTQRTAFTLYGARIGIRANRAAALRALLPAYPPGWKPYAGTRVDWQYSLWGEREGDAANELMWTLHGKDELLAKGLELPRIVSTFERDVQLAVAQTARGKVFVHAGVVGWRGRAILIPGKTYTGKSTLVRELVDAGATYYSDEYAVLDERGRVHPFARPLALRDENKANQKISFEELGGTIGSKPIPVGMVLVTRYREGARWRPRPLTPGMGTLELLANTVTARSGEPAMLKTLTVVAAQATIWKNARGEAREFARMLLARLNKL